MIDSFSGWRGRLARAVPDSLTRRALGAVLNRPAASETLNIDKLREQNVARSVDVAERLGLEFGRRDPVLTVRSPDWPHLRQALGAEGLHLQRLHGQHSYAAQAAWSVSVHRPDPQEGIADLRGSGAIWQLFPGELDALVDAQDFDGKIDAVYTWVDSDDPHWRGTYQEQLRESGRPASDSSVNLARFTSRDELRYSLRSLQMNLPWIDKVYLVTAGQRPDWLVEDHPQLIVVDHREIFENPDQCLPTFNSHAIESQLANIPGLKEHFLYVNDDVFFGRYLHPNMFFGPAGQSKYCLTQGHFAQAEDAQLPVNRAAANNREVVLARFGRTTSRKFQHVAHPQRLAVHRRIAQDQGERIAEIARHRFRSESDLSIPSSLAHQYAAQLAMGYPTKVNYQYLDIGSGTYYLDMLRLARNKTLDMFCINEVLSVEDEAQRGAQVERFLQARFPLRSSYEKC